MGLFEFFGERRNPGPTGGLEVRPPDRGGDALALRVAIAVTALGGWLVLLWHWTSSTGGFVAGIGVSAAYLIVAYFVRPTPDYSNVGLLGGLIDHPFRYSDDINRFLIFLHALLWPGRFISAAIIDAVTAIGDSELKNDNRPT